MDGDLSVELVERAGRDLAARRSPAASSGMAEWEAMIATAGEAGAHAAWLLARHAPPEVQEECPPVLQDAAAREDASPAAQ